MANTWRSLYFALCLICIGLLCRSWVELRLASNDCELKSCTPLCWPVVWSGLDKETPAITPVGPTVPPTTDQPTGRRWSRWGRWSFYTHPREETPTTTTRNANHLRLKLLLLLTNNANALRTVKPKNRPGRAGAYKLCHMWLKIQLQYLLWQTTQHTQTYASYVDFNSYIVFTHVFSSKKFWREVFKPKLKGASVWPFNAHSKVPTGWVCHIWSLENGYWHLHMCKCE